MKRVTLESVTKMADEATKAGQARDARIRRAHAEGHSIRAIAAAARLSHQRVHQILHGR